MKLDKRTKGDGRDEPDTTTTWLVSNILFCYEGETQTGNNSEKKQHFLQHREKHDNNKEAYSDGSKSTRRKVGSAAVFTDITIRGTQPKEASIHIAKITAMRGRG